MAITEYQRVGCDRCGVTKDVADAGDIDRYRLFKGWIRLNVADMSNPDLSGRGLRSMNVLCGECRQSFVGWMGGPPEDGS